ncbi:claudin-22-like [Aulostomus maculatus]
MERSRGVVELLGVSLAAAAWLLALAAALLPGWLSASSDLLPTERFELGLWESCVVQEHGALLCRRYDGLLGLPRDLQLARILMCAALAAGMLTLLLAVPGMRAVTGCSRPRELRCKRAMKVSGGAMSVAAGVLALVPVSSVAHQAVQRFFDPSVPEVLPRWEFGDALFCGWTAGVLHLAAGTLLLTSCLCERTPDCDVIPDPGAVRTRTEYV